MERHLPAATVAQYLMVRLVDIWHFFQVHQTRCEKVFWLERLCGNLGDPSVCMQLRMKLLPPLPPNNQAPCYIILYCVYSGFVDFSCFGPPLPIHLGPCNTKLVPTPLRCTGCCCSAGSCGFTPVTIGTCSK